MRRTGSVSVAVIVPTPELLKQMLYEKPACWTWAAFASVVFQRWAAVEERKLVQVVGSPVRPTGRLQTGPEVAQFVTQHMRAVDDLVVEVGAFIKAPAFSEVFGARDGEDEADPDAIVNAAHQLGDYYERVLNLAEECRRYSTPEQYADLIRDCTRFMNQPLQDFGAFVNDVLERLEQLQNRAMLGQPYVRLGPVPLRTVTDDRLLWSILDRLQTID
ncbi:MAG: hypothetical protein JWP55_5010 [Mycobacterium sp.]|nr:hypothetical protein [Mycobacterium sp.]